MAFDVAEVEDLLSDLALCGMHFSGIFLKFFYRGDKMVTLAPFGGYVVIEKGGLDARIVNY